MNFSLAIQFIRSQASALELARLYYILEGQPASPAVIAEFQASQRPDGGFSPFWAPDYSSLDATCFRWAQAQQLGIPFDDQVIAKALRCLAIRQKVDGSWEEDLSVVAQVPHWARPGELPATLYLTANCCGWLAGCDDYQDEAKRAGDFLAAHQEKNGHLPSFLHTHWLAAGAWLRLGMTQPAMLAVDYIGIRFEDLVASHLAWLITTLILAELPSDHVLIVQALAELADLQQPDGRWLSDDGADFDVNSTLEALFAFKLAGN